MPSAVAALPRSSRVRDMLIARPTVLLIEQAASTCFNFVLGALVAKLGGKSIFGLYATILAITYFLASPLSAMTVAIVASDSARLTRAQQNYLQEASLAAAKLAAVMGMAASAIAVIVSFRQDVVPGLALAPVAVSFVFFTIVADILRRTLLLGAGYRIVALLSLGRAFVLVALAVVTAPFLPPMLAVYALAAGAAMLSALFCGSLWAVAMRLKRQTGFPQVRAMRMLTTRRQLSLGAWGFVAGLTMTALDQGTLVVIGLSGQTHIAGEVRAAAYLFGLMNPLLLVLDLILPQRVMRMTRNGRSVPGLIRLTLLSFGISGVVAACFSLVSAWLWLPYLGSSYLGLTTLCYWAGIAFACMMTRSALVPVLRIRAPHTLVVASLCGTVAGLGYILAASRLTALILQQGMAVSALALLSVTLVASIALMRRTALPVAPSGSAA